MHFTYIIDVLRSVNLSRVSHFDWILTCSAQAMTKTKFDEKFLDGRNAQRPEDLMSEQILRRSSRNSPSDVRRSKRVKRARAFAPLQHALRISIDFRVLVLGRQSRKTPRWAHVSILKTRCVQRLDRALAQPRKSWSARELSRGP